MKFYRYTAVFVPEKEKKGIYNVYVPALRGCLTFGESLPEAHYNIREALELYLLTFLEDGKNLPPDKKVKIPKGAHTETITAGVDFEVKAGFSEEPAVSYAG